MNDEAAASNTTLEGGKARLNLKTAFSPMAKSRLAAVSKTAPARGPIAENSVITGVTDGT